MVEKERDQKEDLWDEIRVAFIEVLTGTFCRDEHDPQEVLRAKTQATRLANDLISSVICRKAGGREVYIPRIPRCLRLVRNKEIVLGFEGDNHSQLGANALFRPIHSRQVRKILKLKK